MTKDEKYLKSLKINSIDRFNELLKRKAFSPSNKYVQELRANLQGPPEGFPNNMPVAVDGGLGRMMGVEPSVPVDVAEGQRQYEQMVAENQPLQDMFLGQASAGKLVGNLVGKAAKGLGRMLPGTTPVNSMLGKRPMFKMEAIPEEQVLKRASDIAKKKSLQEAIDESRREAVRKQDWANEVKEYLFTKNPKLRGQF